MNTHLPSYLLLTEPSSFNGRELHGPTWQFRLLDEFGQVKLSAADQEPGATVERLALLALVRGLESLEGPTRVTLVNPHRYVSRGLSYGLDAWREQHWRWERFGHMVEVRNADLWQRVDHALEFHRLVCRTVRVDAGHNSPRPPHFRKRQLFTPRRKTNYQVA